LNRLGEIFAWVFLGLAVLCLVGWPIAIWRHVNNGLPIVASILETLPYPLGALFFWIVGRGLKLSLDLRPGGLPRHCDLLRELPPRPQRRGRPWFQAAGAFPLVCR
jgi:hypothetical protein